MIVLGSFVSTPIMALIWENTNLNYISRSRMSQTYRLEDGPEDGLEDGSEDGPEDGPDVWGKRQDVWGKRQDV